MSVLILSLFNGILLFRQRTEQSVLYHVCPDAEGLGGTLNSALLKVGLAKKEIGRRRCLVASLLFSGRYSAYPEASAVF